MTEQQCTLQIGPRLELEIVKVEEGLCDGKVLYHGFVHKTAGEAAQQKRHLTEKEAEDQLRAKRRHQQVRNRASVSWQEICYIQLESLY